MNWASFLKAEKEKDYFAELTAKVLADAKEYPVYPRHGDIFNAMKFSPLEKTRAVIVGMDPYHSPGQAHGLSFSVPVGLPIPSSLQNIFKELHADLGITSPNHGCLLSWAENGVLLLNSSLTVRQGTPGSHADYGWHRLTDAAISLLNEREVPCVFILWGTHAKKKLPLITNEKHLILQGVHPSGLSANRGGFFGGKYFSKANDFLLGMKQDPIDWRIASL
jgi:uracil-DNA glycosylase